MIYDTQNYIVTWDIKQGSLKLGIDQYSSSLYWPLTHIDSGRLVKDYFTVMPMYWLND